MAKEDQDPRAKGQQPPFAQKEQARPGSEKEMKPRPDYGADSYRGYGRLTGKVALITGADSGIGRAVALAFAREGADVAIGYLCEDDDANETKRVVEAAGRKAILLRGDLADEATCKRLVDDTVKQLGRLEILVNNAANQDKSVERFEDISAERVERTFQVNVIAQFHLVRHALPHLQPGAVIINTASIQAYQPSSGILDYAATKGAIVTFSKGLAQALVERGIRCNCVAPGPVWTPLVAQSFPDEKLQKFGAGAPMKRPAQPAELAPAFVFLACDDSRYVNGEVLGVTGGELLA